MKKYIAPTLSLIELKEESDIMLQTNSDYADEQWSNKRDDEKPAGSSIWDN